MEETGGCTTKLFSVPHMVLAVRPIVLVLTLIVSTTSHGFSPQGIPGIHEVLDTLKGQWSKPRRIPSLPSIEPAPQGCYGLPEAICKFGNSHDFFTPGMGLECKREFCDPLCLRMVEKCYVKGNGDFKLAGQAPFFHAICRKVIAQACSDAQCCTNDHMLYRWVERAAYDDTYPQSILPLPICNHDIGDDEGSKNMCLQCKQADVKVHFEIDASTCDALAMQRDMSDMIDDAPFHKDSLSAGDGEMNVHKADVSRKFAARMRNTFGSQGTEGSAYPSLQEKCEKLEERIGEALATAARVMDENICECLGCCGDGSKCPFSTFQAPESSGPSGP